MAQASQGPYSCGICAGSHKTEMCNSYMLGANNTQGQKWFQMCRWNFTHATPECVHLQQMAREREYVGQGQQMSIRQEQPKPVLGSQPPPLGATALKYMEPEYLVETGLEMVSSKPYYQEEEQPGSYSWEDFAEMRNMGNESQIGETNPFM